MHIYIYMDIHTQKDNEDITKKDKQGEALTLFIKRHTFFFY